MYTFWLKIPLELSYYQRDISPEILDSILRSVKAGRVSVLEG
jgi:hypothetical protein